MGKTSVTSLKVDEEVWKEAKIRAIREGITLTELLNQALKIRLKEPERPSPEGKKASSRSG